MTSAARNYSSILSEEDGLLLCQAAKEALAEAGMPRPDNGMNGAQMSGLIGSDHYGATGFSVAHRAASEGGFIKEEHFDFHVVVSGDKVPQVRFHHFNEWEGDDECWALHEPVNQDVLLDPIRKIFENFGFQVIEVTSSGHQTHWDYDMDYSVRCKPVLPATLPTLKASS